MSVSILFETAAQAAQKMFLLIITMYCRTGSL